jgi:hypothetical protein
MISKYYFVREAFVAFNQLQEGRDWRKSVLHSDGGNDGGREPGREMVMLLRRSAPPTLGVYSHPTYLASFESMQSLSNEFR